MRKNNALSNLKELQERPYEVKIKCAEASALEFERECRTRGFGVHVSVGGLDSITLLMFLRGIGLDIPAVSVSYLEDKSIRDIHRRLGVVCLPQHKDKHGVPWTKLRVIRECGFPVLTKQQAQQIEILQKPTARNQHHRNVILSPEDRGQRFAVSAKWLKLFGGSANGYRDAPFFVSDKCCYYIKERPLDLWAKSNRSMPYLGLMASEGGRRAKALIDGGCNYYGKDRYRSAPFATFLQSDLLRLAVELDVPIPTIYGEIINDEQGWRNTGEQGTGCEMCGFGVHLQKRPHKFDILRERNPKLWDFWMFRCCSDEAGTYGWARVLDYIGVEWR